MKKFTVLGVSLLLVMFSFLACGKKEGAPEAGSARPEDVLTLIPADVSGVFFVDLHRAMETETAKKAIEDDENYQKIQEFIEKTGIDPQKDLYYLAAAMKVGEEEKQQGLAVLNLKYDKDSFIAMIKEKSAEEGKEVMEEDYNGVTIMYEEGEMAVGFLDSSNIAVSNKMSEVKSMIDVFQKKADNCLKNAAIVDLLDQTNKKAMVWGGIVIPEEAKEEMLSSNPMLQSLEAVSSLSFFFDYKNANIIAEIKVISADATANKQVAEFLTGIKSFGAMAAGEKPEIGELMDKIEISAGDEYVKVSASIPEELIQKLQQKEEQ